MPRDRALAGEDILRLLEESRALRRGHFKLSSGLHSEAYVQCARLLEMPARARRVGEALAARLSQHRPESVLSPALGGVLIGHAVAAALEVPFRFTERLDGKMALRRGFRLQPGERVAVVEDVVTTGRSSGECAAVARERQAEVVAIGAILDRSGGRHGFAVPFEWLLELDLANYDPTACPLCDNGVPLEKPGSRPEPRPGL